MGIPYIALRTDGRGGTGTADGVYKRFSHTTEAGGGITYSGLFGALDAPAWPATSIPAAGNQATRGYEVFDQAWAVMAYDFAYR